MHKRPEKARKMEIETGKKQEKWKKRPAKIKKNGKRDWQKA